MRILSIVHQRDAGSGVFADVAAERGDELVEWVPPEAPPPELDGTGAVLVFGGGAQVDQESKHPWLRGEKRFLHAALRRGTPLLGVCLGAQLLADVAGGSARPAPRPEIGWTTVELSAPAARDPLFELLPPRFQSFQWHSYEIELPPRAVALARSPAHIQAFRLGSAWGIQFHAEVTAETIGAWAHDHGHSADAARASIDLDGLLAETSREIGAWNGLGSELCGRFLDLAARRAR